MCDNRNRAALQRTNKPVNYTIAHLFLVKLAHFLRMPSRGTLPLNYGNNELVLKCLTISFSSRNTSALQWIFHTI